MDELLELFETFLVTNGEVRTELVNGRECLITDATILKEGVLAGSDGPLYYSKSEIGRQIGIWNGVPLVAPHPYIWEDGEMKHVSARDPSIEGKFDVGRVYNDRMEGDERKVSLYFDVENSNRLDGRIVPAVRAKEPINVSTGIFTEKKKAVENSRFNGKPYTHTVHYIQPDHLAVLMDEKGACSVSDGCGINVNSRNKRTNNVLGKRIEFSKDELSLVSNKASSAVLPTPSPTVTVGNYFAHLLHLATSAHILHLQSKSFAEHMALDGFYKGLPDLVDSLIEEYQGCYQKIVVDYPNGYVVPKGQALTLLTMSVAFVRDNRAVVGDKTNLQNTVDEILSLYDSTIYKLKFLK
jgi:uncharacterized protein DUF5856